MGVFIALVFIALRGAHLLFCLVAMDFRFDAPVAYLPVLIHT